MKTLLSLCLIFLITLTSQILPPKHKYSRNPDAGIIPSFTEKATVSHCSNKSESYKIIDGNEQTHWQSDAPLPFGFLTKKGQNIFLNEALKYGRNDLVKNLTKITDGDLNSNCQIEIKGEKAEFEFFFNHPQSLFSLSIKCQARKDLKILAKTQAGKIIEIGTYTVADNFQFKRFDDLNIQIKNLVLSSTARFDVFEIAATDDFPKEKVIIDLGQNRKIGTLYSKHWSGHDSVKELKLFSSQNGENWTFIQNLNPKAQFLTLNNIEPEQKAKFVRFEFTLFPKDWNKASLWEIKIYDKNGHYGKRPKAQPSHVSISEMLGVNGYWGWGQNSYSDLQKPGSGPFLYSPISSHARNYHDITWDLNSPDELIDFGKMNTDGTPSKNWLNWDKEYKYWIKTGMNIQASIQFFRFKDSEWKQPFESSYNYGKAFARHFGISNGNGFVCSMEVGNEPWQYDAKIYQKILLGMAKGAKEADPKMEVFPCALQAADPKAETVGIFKNYIGARISEEHLPYLDGINIHAYSYEKNIFGNNVGTFPENKNSSFWEILNAIRWRNNNMPGKKIYLSEWGWDCGGGGEDCTHSECVSEKAATAYAVRGLMIAQRLGLDRATWYFYANSDAESSLYTRSGLTGSAETDFEKKTVYKVLKKLIQSIGNQYFIATIQEDDNAWIYLFGDRNGKPTHIIGWRPISGNNSQIITQTINTIFRPKSVISLDNQTFDLPKYERGEMTLELSSMPRIIEIRQ